MSTDAHFQSRFRPVRWIALLLLTGLLSACATPPQTRVSGSLEKLSKNRTVALLPIQVTGNGQQEAAQLLRHSLYANLKDADFDLMERYMVDNLLRARDLTPQRFGDISPMEWGEILGADAVVISRMEKVERSYFFIHSSIEVGVTIQMVDTRSGEVLWMAHQTEKDFAGIAKIPTGFIAAGIAPIKFVTDKFNLYKMTRKLAGKVTSLVKQPDTAETPDTFSAPVISPVAANALLRGDTVHTRKTRSQPAQARMPAPLITAVSIPAPEIPQVETLLPAPTKPEPAIKTYEETRLTPQKSETPNWVYTLQVGAYKTKAYAERLLNKLLGRGHQAFLRKSGKKETPIYRVQVEQFKTTKDARRFAQSFTEKEHLDNFVTKMNSTNSE